MVSNNSQSKCKKTKHCFKVNFFAVKILLVTKPCIWSVSLVSQLKQHPIFNVDWLHIECILCGIFWKRRTLKINHFFCLTIEMCENVPNISQQHLEEKKKSRKSFFFVYVSVFKLVWTINTYLFRRNIYKSEYLN